MLPLVGNSNSVVTPVGVNSQTIIAPIIDSCQQIVAIVGGGGTSGMVLTFNGRSGYVVPQANDYTFAQIGSKPTTVAGYGITDAVPTSREINGHDLTSDITLDTSDISDSTNRRYVTDANLVVIGNTSNTNSGDETQSTIKTKLGAASTSADGYLTSSDWNTFNSKASTSLTSSHILVGNSLGVATDVAMSGDATISTTGAVVVTKTNGVSFGGAAVLNVGTTAGTVAAGDDSRITGAVQSSRTVNGHALSADVTVSASDITTGTLPAAQLPDSGVTAGTAGNSTQVPVITYDAKGRITAVSTAAISAGGTGDVSGPASSTDSHVALFDGTTGKSIKDGGALGGAAALNVGTTSGTVAAGDDARITGAVQGTRTVNGHALSADVTVSASDITTGTIPAAQLPAASTSAKGAIQLESSGDTTKYLNGNGAWATVSGGSGAFADITGAPTDNAALAAYLPETASSSYVAASHGKPLMASYVDASAFGDAAIDALSSSLVAHWRFENGALLADSSTGGYTLTNNGGVSNGSSGKSGYCATFSGSNYLSRAGAELSKGATTMLFSVWINPSSLGSDLPFIFEAENTSASRWRASIYDASGHIRVGMRDTDAGSFYGHDSTATVSTGSWHHIVGYIDTANNVIRVSIDGTVESEAKTMGAFANTATSTPLSIGGISGQQYFSGSVDELAVWRNATLDASGFSALASALYNSGSGKFYTSTAAVKNIALAPISWQRMQAIGGSPYRLSLASRTWAHTSDVTAAATLYACLGVAGNNIKLYDATAGWVGCAASELSLSLSGLTASTLYDIYVNNTGTVDSPTLALSAVAWSSSAAGSSSRATALDTTTYGVPVKSGYPAYRYLGTILINSTGGQVDLVFRSSSRAPVLGLWNCYNRVPVSLVRREPTSSWSHSTAAWRQMNDSTANQCSIVVGLAGSDISGALATTGWASTSDGWPVAGLGWNSVTAPIAVMIGPSSGAAAPFTAMDSFKAPVGLNYLAALEYALGTGGINFNGYRSDLSAYNTNLKLDMEY